MELEISFQKLELELEKLLFETDEFLTCQDLEKSQKEKISADVDKALAIFSSIKSGRMKLCYSEPMFQEKHSYARAWNIPISIYTSSLHNAIVSGDVEAVRQAIKIYMHRCKFCDKKLYNHLKFAIRYCPVSVLEDVLEIIYGKVTCPHCLRNGYSYSKRYTMDICYVSILNKNQRKLISFKKNKK